MQIKKTQVASLSAEFLGTAILVMMSIVLTETTGVSYFIATSVAVTLGVVYMFFGSISGAHVNPAITFGMWTARKIGTLRAASYIAAQLLGGLASWQLYQYLTDKTLPSHTTSYSTKIWLAELIGTFILAVGLSAAVTRGLNALETALTYGASFFVGIMVAAVASAGYLNPAISLGLRNWSSVYILGPLAGGLIGVNLYMYLFAPGKTGARKK